MKSISKCYVGMSGGVDSSVAAHILISKGYEVEGVYANCFYDDAQCRNSEDHKDAVRVAADLGIRLETMDYRSAYSEKVLKYFYDEYSKGGTPNPDILCNSEIKFGVMASNAFSLCQGAYLATGHYVGNLCLDKNHFISYLSAGKDAGSSISRICALIYGKSNVRRNFLLSGKDASKDQSYFLYKIYDKTEDLPRYIFPLSEMTKSEVRTMAGKLGIATAAKPDSQGICFIGDVKIREFIKDHVSGVPGEVVNLEGQIIGSHNGVQFFTIGQRHGFKINLYSGEPYYIVDKVLDKNQLIVGNRAQASSKKFIISNLTFPYNIEKILEEFNELGLTVRVRNLGKKIPCKVRKLSTEKGEANFNSSSSIIGSGQDTIYKYEVELSEPEFGVSPGQSAVFYIDRLMLGGGVIDSSNLK